MHRGCDSCKHLSTVLIVRNIHVAYLSCLHIKISKRQVEDIGRDLSKTNNFLNVTSRPNTAEFIVKKVIIYLIIIMWQFHPFLGFIKPKRLSTYFNGKNHACS